ncbi:WD40/YVTN/BNR-like repeat-containing protein [Oceanobacillus picturae]|uniref:WD40/YVTN/BNR-like repeat-containing protein n=1 Tax=Oceanobacillus picturae TaxID=171693 RepID=UPI0036256B4B
MKYFILTVSGLMLLVMIVVTLNQQNSEKVIERQPEVSNQQDNQVQSEQEPEQDSLYAINNEKISYTLQNEALHIAYNQGEEWTEVPIEKDTLFSGEYNGNKQELIEGSYNLTENRVAFLHTQGEGVGSKPVVLTYSLDQGETWKDAIVSELFPPLRFRKVEFLDNQFGFVILSGDRTMSFEYHQVFLTHDGGKTWEETATPDTQSLISDGGFISESTGFMSFGTINPVSPDLYVTEDSGTNWEKAVFTIPERYQEVFVSAEIPTIEEEHLTVLVNQGPNGDYQGGKVKGKFVSENNGKTWKFQSEVEPNEAE